MSLSIGIVGLPNVGKSTLFNALLKKQVALAANYPFATIEPNVGVVPVPDEKLPALAKVVNTTQLVPATVEFIDIAGLVKGASAGAGLGNQFLSHIRQTSAICHVVRGFADDDIIREGSVDPLEDLTTIRLELQLADLATLEKQKEPKGITDPLVQKRWKIVQLLQKQLSGATGAPLALPATDDAETLQLVIKELCLLSFKPELIALNVGESELAQGSELAASWAPRFGVQPQQIVIVCAKLEQELSSLEPEDQKMLLAEAGVTLSGLDQLIHAAYRTLGLQSFYTAGEKEARAWTIRQGMSAPEAAGAIHTDFQKKFIRANIASYADFIASGGWKGVKEAGRLRQEGREYVMQPDDVVEFLIGK